MQNYQVISNLFNKYLTKLLLAFNGVFYYSDVVVLVEKLPESVLFQYNAKFTAGN